MADYLILVRTPTSSGWCTSPLSMRRFNGETAAFFEDRARADTYVKVHRCPDAQADVVIRATKVECFDEPRRSEDLLTQLDNLD